MSQLLEQAVAEVRKLPDVEQEAIAALILAGVFVGRNAVAIHANFSGLWALHDPQTIEPGADWLLLGPEVELRRTNYDALTAADRIRAAEYPDAQEFVAQYVSPKAVSS